MTEAICRFVVRSVVGESELGVDDAEEGGVEVWPDEDSEQVVEVPFFALLLLLVTVAIANAGRKILSSLRRSHGESLRDLRLDAAVAVIDRFALSE